MIIDAPLHELVSRTQREPVELQRIAEIFGPKYLGHGKSWITGGTVRRAIAAEKSHADVDIYSTSREAADKLKAHALSIGFELRKELEKNSVLILDDDGFGRVIVLDISYRCFDPNPYDCIAKFDFTICQFACFYSDLDLRVAYTHLAMHDLMHQVLMPVPAGCGNLDLVLKRARKYASQGFQITPQTLELIARIAKS